MKYCSKCGSLIKDDANFCSMCGAPTYVTFFSNLTQQTDNQMPYYTYCNNTFNQFTDKNSVGLNILSFCFPIVGLILYLVNKDKKPIEAKECGKWALISFIANLILLPFTMLL